MKKMLQRAVHLLLALALVMPLFQPQAFAASTDYLPSVSTSKYIKGYCYRVDLPGNRRQVYTNEACTSKKSSEYIDVASDECYIVGRSSQYDTVYVKYPTSSGRKSRWTQTRGFLSQTSYKTRYSDAWIQTYKLPFTEYGTYGNIDVNDEVRVYETVNEMVRVLYKVSSGYKLAWIKKSDYDRYLSSVKPINVSEGTYIIYTALDSDGSYALDVNCCSTFDGGNVEIYPYHDSKNEQWQITKLGNGYYRIKDTNSGKSLDVNENSTKSETNVQIWQDYNNQAQSWKFYDAGNGYVYIKNMGGCYLDVANGTLKPGNNVWVYTKNKSNAQKWKLVSINDTNSQAEKMVSLAKQEVGQTERSAGSDNIKYNDWYYGKTVKNTYSGQYSWCHVFISWLANQNGVSTSVIPKTASCQTGMDFFKNKGRFYNRNSSYEPKAGDIIYFRTTEGSSQSHHVGIVTSSTSSTVYYIDGNNTTTSPHSVHSSSKSRSAWQIIGYGVPDYK